MKNLGLVFFPAFDWAISPSHPEREERLLYTRDQIVEEGLLDSSAIAEYKPHLADLADLQRVHIGVPNIKKLITDAHLVSAGGAIRAAQAVMEHEVKRSFALVRPPGHHAMRIVHGTRGFCTINIEAIMIEYLRRHYGIRRVAIVDTDVHHGDGTQDIFYHDPDTLFISFHQDGRTLYPGSGFPNELGSPAAVGTNVNLPLPPGTTDEGIHYVFDNLITHMLEDFKPDIIINSAGQDNHYSDPLASMRVTAQGYARLADKLKADIAVLEGGYSIETALPYINVGIILAMAGLDYSQVIEPDRTSVNLKQDLRITAYIEKLVMDWQEIWRNRLYLRKQAVAKANGLWQNRRGIYYDADNITEEQEEKLHLCSNCQGYYSVVSEASGPTIGFQSACGTVLWSDTCFSCRQKAQDYLHQQKKTGEYQHYFLQDKRNDILEYL